MAIGAWQPDADEIAEGDSLLLEDLERAVAALRDPEQTLWAEAEAVQRLGDDEFPMDPELRSAFAYALASLRRVRAELVRRRNEMAAIAVGLIARDRRRFRKFRPKARRRTNPRGERPGHHPDQRPRELQTRWEDFLRSDP